MSIKAKVVELIDNLKSICRNNGLGNDGNEYKIITQMFLYKFLNDKFTAELKQFLVNHNLISAQELNRGSEWFEIYKNLTDEQLADLKDEISENTPYFSSEQLLNNLWKKQDVENFDTYLDKTMVSIANNERNNSLFSTKTSERTSIALFEPITIYVTDPTLRPSFAKTTVNKLIDFSFEEAFDEKYDFFADIFEYLIKDYNTAGGGKYAEYYTPHSIARIMARLLVGNDKDLKSITCYDPSAGTGTLLMSLAHEIGEDRCTIYAQDISQRSNKMLKLNLIINSLAASLPNIVQGDTLVRPYFTDEYNEPKKFDFIVSNPPFKVDFSDIHSELVAPDKAKRFWAGVPNIPKTKKESMAIYTMFLQHVIYSLKDTGKGAIVVPTGFLTAKSGVEAKILEEIVKDRIIYGVISMPSNVFATTGTNVAVLFFDKSHSNDKVILVNASDENIGEIYKDGNKQRRRLRDAEIEKIIDHFINYKEEDNFSVTATYEEITKNNYSLSPGDYFDVKIDYVQLTPEEFQEKMQEYQTNLQELFAESNKLQSTILEQLGKINYHGNK